MPMDESVRDPAKDADTAAAMDADTEAATDTGKEAAPPC